MSSKKYFHENFANFTTMLKFIKDQLTISSTVKNSVRCITAKIVEKNENKKADNENLNDISKCKKIKQRVSVKRESNTFLEMKHYLKSIESENLANQMPKSLRRILKTSHHLYILNKNVANRMANLLRERLESDPDMFIAEANPGFGLLTENLLKMSIPKIHIYEPLAAFLTPNSRLRNIIDENRDRLKVHQSNIMALWSIVFQDGQDETNLMQKLLEGTKKVEWKDKPYITVIGTVMNESFMKQLIMSALYKNVFLKYGRAVFYLIIDPSIWERYAALKNTMGYKTRSIMFQTMFDYEKIDEFQRECFLPWSYRLNHDENQKKRKSLKNTYYKTVYLVRIEPKIDLFDYMSENELLSYHYFVKHHFQKLHTRVIPALEKWIPGCGIKLIMKDYNIYTEFQELDVKEILKLYKEFSSWPEFEECYFLDSSSAFYLTMEDAFHEMGYV